MATGRTPADLFNDRSDTTSTERTIRGLDGESYKLRGTDNSQSTGVDGTSAGDSRETEGSSPQYTRPDSLNLFGWDEEKGTETKGRTRAGRTTVGQRSSPPGINAQTCGNIAAGIWDAISFIVTRTPVLGLNAEEESAMGSALYETVSSFPATSMSVKAINFLAPWAGLIHTTSKIMWKRIAFIQHHKKGPPPNNNPIPGNYREEIIAPNPANVN